jgi:hypothetical protein
MRIASSNVQLLATHEKLEIHTVDEKLRMWGDVKEQSQQQTPGLNGTEPEGQGASTVDQLPRMTGAGFEAELTRIAFSREETAFSFASAAKDIEKPSVDKSGKKDTEESFSFQGDTRLEVMRLLVEKLTGEKVHLYTPAQSDTVGDESGAASEQNNAVSETDKDALPNQAGWGLEYDYKKVEGESERTSFSSSGLIKTADGKEIVVDVSLEMSRERIDITELSVRAGDAKKVDPLVVNFNGTAAALTESKIGFDLNADGKQESISFLRSGSGFLVLDKNGDGAINDGGELFGPTTGNGFAELAAYDEDRNGWIDESDGAYGNLGVWTRTADGTDVLSGLKESNVGAIYLKSAFTPFDLKNSDNETDGEVRSTGVYLQESGQAGTVQHVDLNV